MRVLFAACFMLASFSCSSPNQPPCLAPRSPLPADCPAGVYADATTNDPICLDAASQEICRGEAMDCYVCTGSDFVDGCLIRSATVHQCVHSCSQC
jgi:hypothetical protein